MPEQGPEWFLLWWLELLVQHGHQKLSMLHLFIYPLEKAVFFLRYMNKVLCYLKKSLSAVTLASGFMYCLFIRKTFRWWATLVDTVKRVFWFLVWVSREFCDCFLLDGSLHFHFVHLACVNHYEIQYLISWFVYLMCSISFLRWTSAPWISKFEILST